jgi:hypothetical protein
MRRLAAPIGALLMLMLLVAPAAVIAADGVTQSERIVLTFSGDATLPADQQAEAIFVAGGNALIEGQANVVIVIEGTATLRGATVETLTIINGTANIEAGSTVTSDVLQLNSAVNTATGATIGGTVRPIVQDLAGLVFFLGTAALLMWLGVALATLLAALALAGFASRQVRTAEAVISTEPLRAFLVGLAMVILPPLLLLLLAVTVVGLPLALSMMFFVWPALALAGYLVGAIWVGEWLLRLGGRPAGERPYLAALIGVVICGLLGIIPIVSAVVSIFGLGAITVAGWRTLFRGGSGQRPAFQPYAAPVGG